MHFYESALRYFSILKIQKTDFTITYAIAAMIMPATPTIPIACRAMSLEKQNNIAANRRTQENAANK